MADVETREQRIVPTSNEAATRRARESQERKEVTRTVGGASSTEAVIGAGAAVLSILGLLGVLPMYMAAIATIGIGAAMLVEGMGIAAKYSDMMYAMNGSRYEKLELGGGVSTQILAGITGVVLGILGLLGIYTFVLVPVAIIVYGAGILFGSSAPIEVENLMASSERPTHEQQVLHQTVNAAQGANVLVGIGAGVLGIIALAMAGPTLVLTLVALLSLGAAELIGGSALGVRMGMAMKGRG